MRAWEKLGARWTKVTVLSVILLALWGCVTNPPYQEMSNARQALNAAVEAGADDESPYLVRLAERHLKNAQVAMKERRFNAARNEAVLAHRKAAEALQSLHPTNP